MIVHPSGDPTRGRRSALRSVGFTAVLILYACGGDPTTVLRPPVEIFVAAGDQQYGTVGQTLGTPLQVEVRALTTQLPQSGVQVAWSVVEGDAEIAGVSATISDSTGLAETSVRLGTTIGEVVIRATAQGQSPASVDFQLFLVDHPVLNDMSVAVALPGESIILTGENFIPELGHNVVLFSGVRGEVTAAVPSELVVRVPSCLPERDVDVSVRFGTVGSSSLGLSVGAGGEVAALGIGDVVDAFDAPGLTCVTLPGAGGAEYVLEVHATSNAGAAAHAWTLTGLSSSSATSPALRSEEVQRRPSEPTPDIAAQWDARLRELERTLTADRWLTPEGAGRGPASVIQPAPQVNDVRTFQVYRNPGDFASVTAVARYVGDRAAFFVDQDAPEGGYTRDDLRAFSDQFDHVIWPVVTSAFGDPSDLDANERIVILFTPVVNALTPRGATGFIGGFFFGLDLLPDETGSNAGELFYSLVPDPDGEYSDPRPKSALQEITPAVLSHEFQHMVSFNERVLLRGAQANEAVWLSEGLAQFAEELVARSYEEAGDVENTELFREGVRDRSRRYLGDTENVSLIISSGNGTLEERGAGYLYTAYLTDRFGSDLPGRLARTTRTGVANVEAETGTPWRDVLSDWWAAVVLDEPGAEAAPLVYPSVDLQGFLGDPFPLQPTPLGGADFERMGTLRSSSVAYYIVDPSESGTMTVRLGGEGGGSSAPQAGLRMRIIRVQ
ncbi:MAG: hypothetical protein ACPGPI_00180 [Longimicrobiales bacterium]